MAYNKAREEKKWRLWKEAEEKQLRSLGVSENDIEKLRVHDWAIFNSDRRYYQRMQETGTYLEEVAADMTQPEIKTVEDFLDNIENQQLYQVLIKVDRLSPTVIIAPITSRIHTKAKLPTHTLIKDFDGLDKNSIILFEQIRTIDKQRLREYLGTLDRRFIHYADKALAISIGLAKKD